MLAAGALALAILGGTTTLMLWGALFVFIGIYNFGAKDHPLWGSLSMAAVRGSLVLGGAALGLTRDDSSAVATDLLSFGPPWIAAGMLFGYIAVLTWFSQAEDIPAEPDAAPAAIRRLRARGNAVPVFALIGSAVTLAALGSNALGEDRSSLELTLAAVAAVAWIGYLWGFALAPLRASPPRPFPTTWRLLLGMFWLDAFLLTVFVGGLLVLVPFALLMLTWRPRPRVRPTVEVSK